MTLTTYKWITIATVILLQCSFVLTGWNSWSEYTQCSRSCGGGVKYRERQCVVDRLDRPVCKGKTRTYKLCNTQDCQGGQDFRAEQCEKYNNKPLDGVLYNWRPYYGHGETCELLCFADGFPFFHKMADKVIDGTPCLESNDRVCVDGQCKRVGCDSKIGSHKVFDKCGVCGGDNSTCTGSGDIYGIFSVRQLPPGYSTIVEIPGGARDISITELGENKNSIVFWDSSGENFAIDKDTRQLVPSVKLAGTQFNYTSEDRYNSYGRVEAAGPTLRKITVYAVNEGESNPGIRYSYSLSEINQKSHSEINPDVGEEEKVVTSSNTSDQKTFLKPGNIRISTSNVPSDRRNYGRTNVRVTDRRRRPTSLYDTKTLDWATEDDKENKQQFVYQNAVQVLGGNNSITDNVYDRNENDRTENDPGSLDRRQSLDDFIANEIRYRENWETEEDGRVELESRGSRTRSQVYQDQRFMWSYGQWTECSSKCGSGYQRRIVSCVDRERRETVDEEYCVLEHRPSNTQRCRSDDCQSDPSSSYVRWQVGNWGPCSRTCELGDQVQDVYCEAVFDNGSTAKVDDERCLNQYRDKPQYRRSCNDGVICTQGHMWMFSKWSQCSVTCGQGVQQRSVTCRSKSDQRQVVTANACNVDIKPVTMRRCDMGSCPPERQRQRPDRRPDCRNTFYGCCPDGVTPARGNNLEGCSRSNIDQRLVRVGGRQILNCARLSEQDKEKTYILEWTKHGQASPVYKQYRWRWESYSTSAPEINPNFNGRVRILGDTSLEISQARETDSGLYTCTLVIPISRSDSRRYSNQIFLDVRGAKLPRPENIVITEDDSSSSNRINPSTSSLETCRQQPYQGTCREFVVKWFYNSSSQICERFWYGGCNGKANNFDGEDDCRRTCLHTAPQTDDDVCKQPSVTGRCRARHIRWYYNSNRKECQQFTYGGCGGNQNRFRTLADCQRQCLAGTEALGDQHTCRNSRYGCCPDGVTSAQGNNNEGCPNACQATLYGCCDDDLTAAQGPNQEGCDEIEGSGDPCNMTAYGCCPDGITAATGPAEEGCDIFIVDPQPKPGTDTDIIVGEHDGREVSVLCQLAKNTGPCKNYTVMWYYNTRENQCERFWYGGCDGNTNRFKSEKECVTTCQNMIFRETTLPVCEQPKEIGPCRAALPRWFYNSRTRACEQFFYGGCQGNDNNFDRQDACERQCGVVRERPLTAKEVCAQPQEVGPCRASIQKFYYNAETKRCEQFTYGGCGGNRNNFETETACRQYCRAEVSRPPVTTGRQPVCEMTPDIGPCDRMQTKYFYNITSLSCEPFTYGGCLGNHNNFETQDKCMSYCALRPGRGRTDDCQLSQEAGTCRGSIRRYYYDAQQGRCFPFTYGGCQGNRNNFADERSCMSACQDVRIERPVTRYPSRDKPGYCPMKDDGEVSTCTSECNVDYECSSNMKCCKNGCGGGMCTSPLADEPRRVSDVCSLGLQTPCSRGGGPYYYYEKLSGQCREVPNGECNDNQNNFRSLAECEAYCGRERVCQPLTYESDIRCLAYMEHWTYNRETQACEMFVYGGCGGSANNFQSKEACDRKCLGQVETPVTRAPEPTSHGEVCAMAEDSGNCLAYIRNWRYDSLTGRCVQFTYGGCGGNANNFESREECERFCNRQVVCQKHEDPEITCLAYMTRWRYEPSRRACENFIYGGCGGNANNFETVEACEAKCVEREPEREENNNRVSTWREICNLQADVGPCKQYIKKWHYSSISQSCEEFTYGGCLGNHNNFESREQCMTYCDSSRWYNRPEPVATTPEPDIVIDQSSGEIPTVQPATGVDVCHLESYTGRCRAYIRSWYYDSLTGECKQFIYGGCDTNGNKFDTQEACEAQCSPRAVCTLPKRAGNCFAYITRYYFDYSAQECKEFVYGGCDGNANNFETKEACERRCDPFIRDRPPVYVKRGSCPILRGLSRNGRCVRQCRSDRDCSGSKKCCIIACSYVCIEPEAREIIRPGVVKTGFCPPRTDWQGILGACAPTCQEDSSCPGNQKCCHHGCGLKCVEPVSEEPYQMNAPERVSAITLSSGTILLHWYDPSLGPEQKIRDNRYYTIRFYSYGLGQYEYLNTTELRAQVTSLRPDTEYEFNVRVNDPPYLSEWSENTRNRTASYSIVKAGQCPVIDSDTFGICVEECQNDGDCSGSQKCCSNGCGQTCINPQGYDICGLPKDPGSCSDWEVRWFFNTEIQRCDRFWYGGCNQGNANNFMDEIECQSKCTETQITTPPPRTPRPYDCRRTTFGCCLDRYTPRLDERGSNCAEYVDEGQTTDGTVVPAIPGQSVTLTCRYTSNVTWYRDGKLVESSSRRRVNSDGTIEVYSATIEDDGTYACHVTGSNGRLTIYRYMLQVRVPIGILPGPDKIVVKPNHQAFLHCEVYGNPKPSVSWQKGLSDIRSDGRYETFSNGTLLIRRATEQDIDSYTCRADNKVSAPVQRTIKLELREMLVARIENDNGRVMEGGRIKLTCEGRGYPEPTITWEKMGRSLRTGGNVYIGSDGQQLTIRDVTTSDTGTYSCIVSNSEEKIETSTSVQVVPKVMPDDKCEDKTSLMKCRLIVTARLCGYTMYSKICCASCRQHFNGE